MISEGHYEDWAYITAKADKDRQRRAGERALVNEIATFVDERAVAEYYSTEQGVGNEASELPSIDIPPPPSE
jgi:hypothetical protein